MSDEIIKRPGRGNPAWKKGMSANPGGRPRELKLYRDACKAHTMEALEYMVNVMRDGDQDTRNRLWAAEMIINRAYGKASSEREVEAMDAFIPPEVKLLSTSELIEKIREMEELEEE
jgi:hypothetical protein